MRCIPADAAAITLGVDTHKDFHVALALDALGRRLEQLDRLVVEAAPELVGLEGVGTDTAASLLIAALVTIPSGSTTRQPLRTCAELHRSGPLQARVCAIV